MMQFITAHINLIVPVGALVLLSATARAIHFYLFNKHFHLTFAGAPWRSLGYFAAWSLVVGLMFPTQTAALFAQVTPTHYFFLTFMLLVIFPGLYRETREHAGRPEWLLAFSPEEGMLTLGERYIIAKIADVVFQQLIAGAMILTLATSGVAYPTIVGVFVVLFAAAHLYLFRTAGMFWGIYYTTYAALGGFAFTFLIIFVQAGIVYAILIHMLFYVLSGILFAKLPRPSKAMRHDLLGVGAA